MHLTAIIVILFITWRWGDWRNWRKYHATLLFMTMGNLLYNFIYANHLLWQIKVDFLYSSKVGELFYSFILLPCTALILLTNYPKDLKKQVFRLTKFNIVFIVVEFIYYATGRILYNYGWNIWWSLAWDIVMFSLIILHYKKPMISYIASLLLLIVMLAIFPTPLSP